MLLDCPPEYIKITTQDGFIGFENGILFLILVWKQFHIFAKHPISWRFSLFEWLRKKSDRFPGTLGQSLLNTVNVFWCSVRLLITGNTHLLVDHASKLFIWPGYCRSAWCFPALKLRSEVSLNHANTSSLVKSFHQKHKLCYRACHLAHYCFMLSPRASICSHD